MKALTDKAADRIIIMPGSGVRSSNILELAKFTGSTELHSSARIDQPSSMLHQQKSMKEILRSVSVDVEEIKKMKSILTRFSN
ncbi:MAG: copper homeostasis protein CutC [Bacteroidota bacterium]